MDVREHRHPGFVQQALAQLFRVLGADHAAGLGDIGPGVERAPRQLAAHARHPVQQAHDQVAPGEKTVAHFARFYLRAVDSLHRRPLADVRRTGVGVGHPAHELRRQDGIRGEADAPAGHGPGLGGAVGNDAALVHPRQRRNRCKLALVQQARIDFVGKNPDLGMAAQHLGDVLQILLRQDAAGRVMRGIEDQQFGLRRYPGLELGRVKGEVARLAQVQRHRHRTAGEDLRFVDRKTGIGVDHLVADAVIGGAQDGVGDERFRARADHHMLRIDREAAQAPHVLRRRRAQLRDPGRGRVAVPALADRLDRGILDIDRRVKVRLADAEGNDAFTLTNKLVDLGEHDKGVLGAEFGGTAAGLGHARASQRWKTLF